jgi:hypothetical protein
VTTLSSFGHETSFAPPRRVDLASTTQRIRTIGPVEPKDVGDRQLDALLERLDRIADELERLNRAMEKGEGLTLVAREIRELTESMNALAYAALGQAPPRVRRRAG